MKTWLAALAATLLAAPGAVAAQDASAAKPISDEHELLFDTINALGDQEAALHNLVAAIAAQLAAADPELARAEARHPGLMHEIAEALRPIMIARTERLHREYRPRMIAALRDVLTREEAQELERFYNSEAGRAVVAEIGRNTQYRATVGDALNNGAVSSDAVSTDRARTMEQVGRSLTDEQRSEVVAAVSATPAFLKMPSLMAATLPLRTEMENSPLSDDEKAELIRVVNTTISAREKRRS
jgi:hypothetical protein